MRWLQNFMRGRYGVDQLSIFLLVIYIVVTLLTGFFQLPLLSYAPLAILIWCWFRILSRKTYKRSKENTTFLRMVFPITKSLSQLEEAFS